MSSINDRTAAVAAAGGDGSCVQSRFVTRESTYSVPADVIALEGDVGPEQLSALINQLLEHNEHDQVAFEFFIGESVLLGSLKEHLADHEINAENVVEIEYAEKCPCPEPVDSLAHDDWVSAVHCARIGSRDLVLSGAYDCSVSIWTTKGKKLITLSGHQSPVKAVRWVDFDGTHARFVSTSHDETALLWSWHVERNQLDTVVTCRGHQRSVDCTDVDLPNKRFATSGFDNVVKLWSTSTEETELDVKKDDAGSEAKRSRPEGDGHVVQRLTRTPLVSFASHTESVTGVEFMSSTEMLTCSMDCTLKVWDVDVGGFSNSLLGSKPFLGLSYSPLSRMIVTAHADRHVRMWDPRSMQGSVVKANFTSHEGWVSSVCWSPTIATQFISASFDTVAKLWDTRSMKAPLYDMEGHEERLLCCDWSLPEYMVTGGADNKLKIFKHTAPYRANYSQQPLSEQQSKG